MSGIKFNSGIAQILAKQYQSQLEQMAQIALKQTANNVEEKLKDFINQYFYGTYNPKFYKRTYKLLKSITQTAITKVGHTYSITVYLNPKAVGDYYVNLQNNSFGNQRFYINNNGQVIPQGIYAYDAGNVFDLASQGIHGLPANGNSGWKNNNFIQTSPGFVDMMNEEMFYTDLITKYNAMLRSNGFQVKIIS